MKRLTVDDLMKLEDYARERKGFREKLMAHKKYRSVAIGPHMTLLFEDHWTIQYQIQEMLRIEKIFEREAIEEELSAYNPLIPDGSNWKATCLIEFPDVEERKQRLVEMRGVEDHIWVQAGNGQRVFAIADEDMERSDASKTSAVHFLRFELPHDAVRAVKQGELVRAGVTHDAYRHDVALSDATRDALAADLAEDQEPAAR